MRYPSVILMLKVFVLPIWVHDATTSMQEGLRKKAQMPLLESPMGGEAMAP